MNASNATTCAPLLEWQDGYCLGIDLIDRQHQHIVYLINDLHSLVVQGASRSAHSRVFSELLITIAHHFRTEEVLMEFTRYPELLEHQDEHRKLMVSINMLKKVFDARESALGVQDVELVLAWIVEHTVNSDQKYKPFLKQFL